MRVALVTAPAGEAEDLARRIVESSLAACVNLLLPVDAVDPGYLAWVRSAAGQ